MIQPSHSIILNQSSSTVPPMTDFKQFADLNLQVSQMIISSLRSLRASTEQLIQRKQSLKNCRQLAFSHLDALIESNLIQKQREVTIKKRKKRFGSQPKIKNQSISFSKENHPTHSVSYSSQCNPEKTYIFAKKRNSRPEVFFCFLCLKNTQHEGMWLQEYQYLKHMNEDHGLDCQFEPLVRSSGNTLWCSHVFFKGILTNLCKGFPIFDKFYTIYLLIRQMYGSVFCCLHKNKKLRGQLFSQIFDNQNEYLQHISKCELKTIQSHDLKGNKLFRNEQFVISNLQLLKEISRQIQNKLIFHLRNRITLRNILIKQPRNILQLVSRYPTKLNKPYFRGVIPYCQKCQIFLESINKMSNHYNYEHSQQLSKVLYREFSYQLFLKWVYFMTPSFNQMNRIQQEQAIINNQLQLIKQAKKREFFQYKSKYICGHCHTIFSGMTSANDFFLHIYLDHSDIHHLNSHSLRFMKQGLFYSQKEEERS